MMEMQKRNYKNEELNVQINCYIDKHNELWFCGKEIALILENKNSRRAIRNFVHDDDKKLMTLKVKVNSTLAESLEKNCKCFFINESGFYSLILSSKQPKAKEFKRWVTKSSTFSKEKKIL